MKRRKKKRDKKRRGNATGKKMEEVKGCDFHHRISDFEALTTATSTLTVRHSGTLKRSRSTIE